MRRSAPPLPSVFVRTKGELVITTISRSQPLRGPASRWLKVLSAGLLAMVLSGCLPIPIFSMDPVEPEAGETITFDASETILSNIPEGNAAVSHSWDFGDGSTGRGKSTTHAYEQAGSYLLKLSVTDSAGRVGTVEERITVKAATSTSDSDSSTSTSTSTSNSTSTFSGIGTAASGG